MPDRDTIILSLDPEILLQQLQANEQQPVDMRLPNSEKWSIPYVLKYALFYTKRDDVELVSHFVHARQGSFMFHTLHAAEAALTAIRTNNNNDRLVRIFGDPLTLYVGYVICYEHHYDPAPYSTGSADNQPAAIDKTNATKLRSAFLQCHASIDQWLNGKFSSYESRMAHRLTPK